MKAHPWPLSLPTELHHKVSHLTAGPERDALSLLLFDILNEPPASSIWAEEGIQSANSEFIMQMMFYFIFNDEFRRVRPSKSCTMLENPRPTLSSFILITFLLVLWEMFQKRILPLLIDAKTFTAKWTHSVTWFDLRKGKMVNLSTLHSTFFTMIKQLRYTTLLSVFVPHNIKQSTLSFRYKQL